MVGYRVWDCGFADSGPGGRPSPVKWRRAVAGTPQAGRGRGAWRALASGSGSETERMRRKREACE